MMNVEKTETGKKGQGAFALNNFKKDAIVLIATPIRQSECRTIYTVEVKPDVHMEFDEPFNSTNHSCDPNTKPIISELNEITLVALRDIEQGEEITWDYCETEYVLAKDMICLCNSPDCRKIIRGRRYRLSKKE